MTSYGTLECGPDVSVIFPY